MATQIDKLKGELGNFRAEIETIKDEEQTALDNMPESFADSERGELAQAAVDHLSEVDSALDDIESSIDSIVDSLSSATGE